MSKSSFAPVWEWMRMRHGVGLRCIEALPADQLDAHPVKDMRTPKELVVHMYSYLAAALESIATGTFAQDEPGDLSRIRTKPELVAFADRAWKAADAAWAKITDAQLTSTVTVPWGGMKGSVMLNSVQEEYLHHRGQLYAFLRQLGVKPPDNWDFEANAPEYQPKQHA